MQVKRECTACGSEAITALLGPDGKRRWYCGEHIPDPAAKKLHDMLYATRPTPRSKKEEG
jgi:hypothetical protein